MKFVNWLQNQNKILPLSFRLACSIGLISMVVWDVGLKKLLDAAVNCEWRFFLIGFLPFLLTLPVSYMALELLMPLAAVRHPSGFTFSKYLRSWAYGLVAPGKIGELSLSYMVSKDSRVPIGATLATCLADKIVTLTVSALIALVGTYLFFTNI